MRYATHQREQGVALAISLILLLALTILGVATLTSTRFQEQITSNSQQKSASFEAAESAINSVLVDRDLIINSIINVPPAQFNDPDPVFPAGFEALLSTSFDQTNDRGVSLDINSAVSIQYCGERAMTVGTELSGDLSRPRTVAMTFDVNGTAEIDNTNARSDHVQRASLARPETRRTGNCVTPIP